MYAVIETGGKQYRVELGSELHVELTGASPGSEISFDRVLLVRTDSTTEIGTPVVAGAKVTATVLGQERGPKTISFKYRPKARSRITKGHRQELHLIKVTEVAVNGTSAKALYEVGAADRAKAQTAAAAVATDKAKADAAVAATLNLGAPAEAKAQKPAAQKPAAKRPATAKPAAKSADASAVDAE